MAYMFYDASAFDKDVIGWNVCKVSSGGFLDMFTGSGQPGNDLSTGTCVDCPTDTFSGSGQYVQGGNNCTSV
jgi:hypothetical protein